eukprot:COSAG06_NODE_8059_length_2286_cov_1.889346_4_plen_129_part_00
MTSAPWARTWRDASALELEVIRPGHAAAGQLREAAERRPSREPSPRPTPAAGLAESSHERAAASPCTARPISPLRGPPHDCTPAADERRRLALRYSAQRLPTAPARRDLDQHPTPSIDIAAAREHFFW